MPSLYVTRPGSRLELEHGRLLATMREEVLLSVPAARVDRVIVVGGVNVTSGALSFLLDHGIDLVFITTGGQVRGRLDTGATGSLAARRAQYGRADDPAFCLRLGKAIVAGKARNARTRCMELDDGTSAPVTATLERMRAAIAAVDEAPDLDTVRGIEGRIARWYFGILREHLNPLWTFERRARRPPPDPVNAVLSITYTLLQEQCRTALAVAGLDPECGFLHAQRPGRPSLALDLMEEFRPVIADAVTWALFNNRMLAPGHFRRVGDREVRLTPEGWQRVASQYTRRIETGILIPGRKTKTTYRKLLEVQAWQIRKVIEGEQAVYEPFRSR